jgi:Beta propeller domain
MMELDPLILTKQSSSTKHNCNINNMKIDIPSGDESVPKQEQATPETAPERKKDSSQKVVTNKSSKAFAFVGAIVVLAVIAIVVALLPDWGDNDSTNNMASSNLDSTSNSNNNNSSSNNNNNNYNNSSSSTNSNDINSSGSNATASNESTPLFFESTQGPFEIKIPLLSSNITNPYTSVAEAKHDLEELAKYVVNTAIVQRSSGGPAVYPGGPDLFLQTEAAPTEDGDRQEANEGAGPASGSAGSDFGGVSDFETYQQEIGVIRSDFVKSNGAYLYAAMSSKILIWDLEGNILDTVIMPPINVPEVEPVEVQDEEEVLNEDVETETTTAQARSSPVWGWTPEPYIDALLLNSQGTRLTAVVSGYGTEYDFIGQDVIPVLDNYKGTRIIVYDIQDDGTLSEVSQTDINGYHLNSYTVGDNVHIVTKTGLRTWDHLIQPIDRWMPEFEGMSDEEYEAAAKAKAEELIPVFVDEVMDLYTKDGQVTLSRLAVFAESISDDDEVTDIIFSPGIANSITEVNSFDMGQVDSFTKLSVSTSATLQPGQWGYVYATPGWIWVADQGWRWVKDSSTYVQDTILLGFRLDGSSSSFVVYGSIPGSLLSQFSIDFYKDLESGEEYVRAATTINFSWGGWWGAPEVDADLEDSSRTKNQVIIMKVPALAGDLQVGDKLEQLGSVELGKKDEVRSNVVDNFAESKHSNSSHRLFLIHRVLQLCVSLTTSRTLSRLKEQIRSMFWICQILWSRRCWENWRFRAFLSLCIPSRMTTPS